MPTGSGLFWEVTLLKLPPSAANEVHSEVAIVVVAILADSAAESQVCSKRNVNLMLVVPKTRYYNFGRRILRNTRLG